MACARATSCWPSTTIFHSARNNPAKRNLAFMLQPPKGGLTAAEAGRGNLAACNLLTTALHTSARTHLATRLTLRRHFRLRQAISLERVRLLPTCHRWALFSWAVRRVRPQQPATRRRPRDFQGPGRSRHHAVDHVLDRAELSKIVLREQPHAHRWRHAESAMPQRIGRRSSRGAPMRRIVRNDVARAIHFRAFLRLHGSLPPARRQAVRRRFTAPFRHQPRRHCSRFPDEYAAGPPGPR
jgi:hypothetical protein